MEDKFLKGQKEEEDINDIEKLYKKLFLFDIKPLDINEYEKIKKIGEGQFGKVFKVSSIKTAEVYAAKVFYVLGPSMDIFFIRDNIILSHISHPSIIKYIGYSLFDFEYSNKPIIIMEYCKNGSLYQLLENDRHNKNIEGWNDTMKLINAYGIASAMMYLHSLNILHRDLKSSNILIDDFLCPFVTDFGLSLILNDGEEEFCDHSGIVGTLAYTAPEIISKRLFSKKSDVYAYSIILYEIFVGPFPYSQMREVQFFLNVVNKKLRPKFNIKILPAIQNLIESCWDEDPQKRPSFEYIVTMLKNNREFITDKIDIRVYHEYIQMIDEEFDKKQNPDDIRLLIQKNLYNSQEELKESEKEKVKEPPIRIDPTCTSCNKEFENKSDILYISGLKYHKDCVKCAICHKKLESDLKLNDLVCVTPGMLFCKEDYENYLKTKKLDSNVLSEYGNKMIKNFLKELSTPIYFKDSEYIEKFSQTDFFLEPYNIENSFQFSKYYKYFVPTVTFHFNILPSNEQIKKFIKILPKTMMIVNIERGSILLVIAFLGTNQLHLTEEKYREIIEPLMPSLNTAMGESIVGQPTIQIPDNQNILDLLTQNSINLLQNTEVLNQIDIDELKDEIYQILLRQTDKNWDFIYDHFDLFLAIGEQTRKNIQKNGIEVIIIGETIIADKHFDEYESIRSKIISNGEEETECFLYHGTSLEMQLRIIENHFLQPGVDTIEKQLDNGYYGKGIYATNNIYYASIYSKGYNPLQCNDKETVLGCLGILSRSHSEDILDMQQEGLPLPQDRISHYGIHRALVGSSNRHFYPITRDKKDENFIVAKEFVFPNKYQIMPVISFIIKRTSFCIIWADELSEYSNHLQMLRDTIKENVYSTNSIDDTKKMIELKKRNVIKLIISSKNEKWCKNIIEDARKVFGSDVVCLIYSENKNHTNFAKSMKNVLFTNDVENLRYFADMNMQLSTVCDFSEKLGFNINEHTILNFKNLTKFKNDFMFTEDLIHFKNDLINK